MLVLVPRLRASKRRTSLFAETCWRRSAGCWLGSSGTLRWPVLSAFESNSVREGKLLGCNLL